MEAIFFMTYFHRAGGGHGPLGPLGSATALFKYSSLLLPLLWIDGLCQMFVFHCEDITCISNFSIKIYIKCLNESIQNQIVLYFRKLKTQNVCKISCGRLILNTNQSEVADPGGPEGAMPPLPSHAGPVKISHKKIDFMFLAPPPHLRAETTTNQSSVTLQLTKSVQV